MPLELIGVGFGRTGTDSTRVALNRLGYPCYHMREVIENRANRSHLDFWNRVAASEPGTQHDWEEVFAHYRATVDNPAACVWRELIEAYPDAKVLLTLHPGGPDAWYDSTLETIYSAERMWEWALLRRVWPWARKLGEMTKRLVWQRSLRGTMKDRARAIARYHEHIDEVIATVPEDRLLVYRVSEGWPPLCELLGEPVPDEPFPRVNERKAMRRTVVGVGRVGAWTVIGLAGLVVALVVRALTRHRRPVSR